jgi:cadmium resistance protein CadD (predicted permease)
VFGGGVAWVGTLESHALPMLALDLVRSKDLARERLEQREQHRDMVWVLAIKGSLGDGKDAIALHVPVLVEQDLAAR